MGYFCDSPKLCVVNADNDRTCYDKDEIREMLGDRYADDNESIDYYIDIISNDGNEIEAKCVSKRRKSNGSCLRKEEYDTCSFGANGCIKEFIINRSNQRSDPNCNEDDSNYVRPCFWCSRD